MPLKLSDYKLSIIKNNDSIAFNCGDLDLNEFFCKDALYYQEELLARTYQYTDANRTSVAMFSVSNDHISLSGEAKKVFPTSKQLRYYPAVKIARLGVATNFAHQKLGCQIIGFLKMFFLIRNKTGCRYITVDAYNKGEIINFYEKNGFQSLTDKDKNKKTRTMYFDLLPLYKALQNDASQKRQINRVVKKLLK